MENRYEKLASIFASAAENPSKGYQKNGLMSPTSDVVLKNVLEEGKKGALWIRVQMDQGFTVRDLEKIQWAMNSIEAAMAVVEGRSIPMIIHWNIDVPEEPKQKKPWWLRFKEFFFPSDFEDEELFVPKL